MFQVSVSRTDTTLDQLLLFDHNLGEEILRTQFKDFSFYELADCQMH